MNLIDEGRGPAVVLLHGCPGTLTFLAPLVEALSPTRRVIAPELPGYGASPPLEGPYSFDRVQALLEDLLLARGVRECALVGHSAGAYRAIGLALGSTRVRATHLVTLGGLAGLDPEVRAAFRQFADLARQGFDFRPMWLGRMAAPGFAERFPQRVGEVMSWIDAAPRAVLAAELDALAGGADHRPRLGELAIPVTARVGEHDAATPPVCSEEIARGVRRGELQVVRGCGHALLHEDREATVRAVATALSP